MSYTSDVRSNMKNKVRRLELNRTFEIQKYYKRNDFHDAEDKKMLLS